MPLSDVQIKKLKPADKDYKVTDEKGLYLLVTPAGGRLWRMKFRSPLGKERKLSFGGYPDVSLKEARRRRDAAREELAAGIDPAEQKREQARLAAIAANNSFSAVAEAYIAKNERDGLAENTIRKRRWFLALVAKTLGPRPISEIMPIDVLEAVRPFEKAKNDEKAHRTLEFIGQVFRYAVASQLAPSDVTRDLRGALAKRQPRQMAAIIEPLRIGPLMRLLDGYEGQPLTRVALLLSAHLFPRPGELRQAEWSEIDFAAALWTIPAEKVKARRPHRFPLSTQVIGLLREAQLISGDQRYVFPSIQGRGRPMSENTVNVALRRIGYRQDEMTAHGFRAMASSILNESGLWHPDAIERALAHKDKDSIRAAYHRGEHWDERVRMAQWWSDWLDNA